jgi:uncharacterized membrane protein
MKNLPFKKIKQIYRSLGIGVSIQVMKRVNREVTEMELLELPITISVARCTIGQFLTPRHYYFELIFRPTPPGNGRLAAIALS